MERRFELIDKEKGQVVSLIIYNTENNTLKCFNVTGWIGENCEEVYSQEFVAEVYARFDACTHWYMYGEDWCEGDKIDAYYHICGAYCLEAMIRNMLFIWAVIRQVYDTNGVSEYSKEAYRECHDINVRIDDMLTVYDIVEKGE